MRRRSDREHIKDHQLAVRVPAEAQKAGLRLPAVRQNHPTGIQHPGKVRTVIDQCREPDDFRIVRKSLAHRQNARQKQRRVNRGDLALPAPLARARIQEMVKPAMDLRRAIGKEAEGGEDSLAR